MAWRRRPKPVLETLVCPGVFAVAIPDGWVVSSRPGEYYELSPPRGGPDVSVAIAVHPQSEALLDRGVVDLLQWFATAGGDEVSAFSATTAPEGDAPRAFGRWSAVGRTWFGGSMFTGGVVVIASSNSTPGDSATYRLGEQLIAAIRPV